MSQLESTHYQLSGNRKAVNLPFSVRGIVLLLVTLNLGGIWSSQAQTQYTNDGTPTSWEEEIRWRVNRGRFDSASDIAKSQLASIGIGHSDRASADGATRIHVGGAVLDVADGKQPPVAVIGEEAVLRQDGAGGHVNPIGQIAEILVIRNPLER